jgi:ribosome biogenesis GTPase A
VIALVDDSTKVVTVLLLYSKNEISPPNETAKWQKEVKENFPGLRSLVK